MPNLGLYNWMDFAIFLIVAGGLLVGYTQGLLRQIIGLAALYLATIVATQYYLTVSKTIYGALSVSPSRFVNLLSFLFIFFTITAIINILAADAYQMTKLRLYPVLDHLGGSLLGLVTIIILLCLFLPIFQFVSGEPFPYFDNAREAFVQGLENSRLVTVIYIFRPELFKAIVPWLPNGQIPSIFNL